MNTDTGTPFDGNMIVKNVLHRYQISQTDLCQKLGYSREAFSKVVNGHRALSVGWLITDEADRIVLSADFCSDGTTGRAIAITRACCENITTLKVGKN